MMKKIKIKKFEMENNTYKETQNIIKIKDKNSQDFGQ